LIVIQSKLLKRGIDKTLFRGIAQELWVEVQEWIFSRIEKEIQKYKSKGYDGMDIIQRLMRKGYRLDDIKRTLKARDE
jgi:SOS response regulatory protein OraA/RecX